MNLLVKLEIWKLKLAFQDYETCTVSSFWPSNFSSNMLCKNKAKASIFCLSKHFLHNLSSRHLMRSTHSCAKVGFVYVVQSSSSPIENWGWIIATPNFYWSRLTRKLLALRVKSTVCPTSNLGKALDRMMRWHRRW